MGFLVLSMLFFLMRTLCNKEYTKSFSSRQSNFVFNAISMTITCLVAALFGGVKKPTGVLLVLCALFGIIFVITIYLMLIAYARGPLSLVTLVFHLSTVVPVLFGLLLFHEPMNWMKAAGFAAALAIFVLSWLDDESKSAARGEHAAYIPSKVWLPITLLMTFTNGCLSTLQNMAVQWSPDSDIMTFNFWAYLIGAVILWILVLISHHRQHTDEQIKAQPKKFFLQALLNGIGSTGGNIFIMYALVYVASTVAYPLEGCLLTVTTYLIGLLYYKEPRTKYGIFMLLLGVASIILFGLA